MTKRVSTSEKRTYQRVQVDASAFVRNPPPSKIRPPVATGEFGNIEFGSGHTATNISWRGARICGIRLLGEVGKRVELVLPAMSGEGITLLSRIMWEKQDDDEYASGVRFSHASPKDEGRFLTVPRILLTRPDPIRIQASHQMP